MPNDLTAVLLVLWGFVAAVLFIGVPLAIWLAVWSVGNVRRIKEEQRDLNEALVAHFKFHGLEADEAEAEQFGDKGAA